MQKKRNKKKNHIAFALILACILALPAAGAESAYAAPGYDKVAKASETAGSLDVGKYGMLPIYGVDIRDGTYTIQGESSSSFFHIDESELIVENGKLLVRMKIPSSSYKYVYMGTAEQAAAAPLEDYIAPDEKQGISTFEIPIDALDKELPCAAFSKRRKQWYDRTIVFDASSLPQDALLVTLPDYDRIAEALALYDEANGTDSQGELDQQSEQKEAEVEAAAAEETEIPSEPVDLDMEDGTYSIQVNMTGGSGRASVSSPTWLIVKDKKAYARLLWSSTYYDYMIVDGQKYLNESTDGGNSTFTIPITVMDDPMTVIGDTTAMGDPVEIEYRLTFYEGTIGSKSQIPQEAAIYVLIFAAVIIVAGGILNYFVKKRRKH